MIRVKGRGGQNYQGKDNKNERREIVVTKKSKKGRSEIAKNGKNKIKKYKMSMRYMKVESNIEIQIFRWRGGI